MRKESLLLILYKKETGYASCPTTYVTEDEYRLGKWQGYQRASYHNRNLDVENRLEKKMGKISNERIKKLEDIGFLWTLPHPSSREYYKLTGQKDPRFKNL